MADIKMRRGHTLGKQQARHIVETLAKELQGDYAITYRWEGDDLRFERTGADGCIRVGDQDVSVEVSIGWLLSPLQSMVEREIQEYLDKNFI